MLLNPRKYGHLILVKEDNCNYKLLINYYLTINSFNYRSGKQTFK